MKIDYIVKEKLLSSFQVFFIDFIIIILLNREGYISVGIFSIIYSDL